MRTPNPFKFIAALCRMAKAKLTGRKLKVEPLVVLSRKLVCETCPLFNKEFRQCLECTCFIDWKVPFATERCPLGKWERELFATVG